MKTNYAITRNGEILVESSDLEYLKKIKSKLDIRQTGRTTRMLFQALGDNSRDIVIVAFSRASLDNLLYKMAEILTNLDFKFTINREENTLTNFGRTYHFVYREQLRFNYHRGCKDIYKDMTKYLDEI